MCYLERGVSVGKRRLLSAEYEGDASPQRWAEEERLKRGLSGIKMEDASTGKA